MSAIAAAWLALKRYFEGSIRRRTKFQGIGVLTRTAQSRCTARFGCRNQDRKVPSGELFICMGDDKLDYRSAWEL